MKEHISSESFFSLNKGSKEKLIQIGHSVFKMLIKSEMQKIGHYEWRYIEEKAIHEGKFHLLTNY